MHTLPPLPVAIPLAMAAVLAGAAPLIPRRLADSLAILTAGTVALLNALLLQQAAQTPIIYWFGGWHPREGIAPGIAFVIDPLAAGMSLLVAVLTTAALIFSWRYFETVGTLFHTLMLIFLGAMVGFCFSGDIFTLFVFFELMSVTAYTLTGHKIEESSLEGAFNFAITNSVGAFLVLWGIVLLYGRTGALNLAQLGHTLLDKPADGLIVAAFILITCGFFVKAAILPFYLWLDDAHAVAPSPVCLLFSGVMIELGLYGAFRVYWTVFHGTLGRYEDRLHLLFIFLGAATALIGAIMCLAQRHLKRLLAFSSISHMGLILAGVGTLTAQGLAGGALYTVGHGFVKGGLFLGAGILLHRLGSVDEIDLQGRGRGLWPLAIIFALGGLGLAGFPPYGTYLGKSLMEESADKLGQHWLPWLFTIASALTGGAVLRATGRIFLGWGARAGEEADAPTEQEKQETSKGQGTTPLVMLVVAGLLVVIPIISGLFPHFATEAHAAGERFMAQSTYIHTVMDSQPIAMQEASEPEHTTAKGLAFGFGTALAAVIIGLLALFEDRVPQSICQLSHRITKPLMTVLRAFHSGHVGDYVTWLVVGTALFGVVFIFIVRH